MKSSKAPKRGCTFCSQCGESNGNRALKCKSCFFQFRDTTSKKAKVTANNITQEISALSEAADLRIFSCKVRREGPDYRTFVTENSGKWKCYSRGCSSAQHVRQRSSGENICEHISSAKSEELKTGPSQPLNLCTSVLEKLAVPERHREELLKHFSEHSSLIHRVTETTFVVRDRRETQEHPLSLLHVRFSKSTLKQSLFHCPCSDYQTTMSGSAVISKPSRRCLHFYLCFWAIKCNPDIAFEYHSIFSLEAGIYTVFP